MYGYYQKKRSEKGFWVPACEKDNMELLYQEIILDHYRNPRNRKVVEQPDFTSTQHNPSCGDSITWQGRVSGGRVIAVGFDGAGCVISQATASLLSEAVLTKSLEEIVGLDAAFITALIGISLGPTRLKCALLSLEALKDGVKASNSR